MTDDDKDLRSEAISGAIQPQSDSESESGSGTGSEAQSESQSQTQSQTESPAQSQSQTQSQTQSVKESLGVNHAEEDLKSSRKHVNMYLDEDLAEALDDRFTEVSALNQQQKGYDLEKNRDFYPALIEAAFRDDVDVLDVLDLEN